MGIILPIVATLLGIGTLTAVIIIRVVAMKRIAKMDVIDNADFIEVGYRKRFTEGYSKGIVKKQVPLKNGCTRFIFYPIDMEQGEHKPIPSEQIVIVKDEFIKRLARGEESSYRNVIRLVDRFKTELPEKMRDTEEGEALGKEGQKRFLLSAYGKWVQAGDDALYESITELSRIGMTKLNIAALKEQTRALQKELQQSTEEKKQL
jgi:hypothetical protein